MGQYDYEDRECPECGETIDDPELEFCPECGAELEPAKQAAKPQKCPSCGAKVAPMTNEAELQARWQGWNPVPGSRGKCPGAPPRAVQINTLPVLNGGPRYCAYCGASLVGRSNKPATGQTGEAELEQRLAHYMRRKGLVLMEASTLHTRSDELQQEHETQYTPEQLRMRELAGLAEASDQRRCRRRWTPLEERQRRLAGLDT